MAEGKNYIAGEWVGGSETAPDISPSNTDDIVGHFSRASAPEAERAMGAAKDVFPVWSRSSSQVRHDILNQDVPMSNCQQQEGAYA